MVEECEDLKRGSRHGESMRTLWECWRRWDRRGCVGQLQALRRQLAPHPAQFTFTQTYLESVDYSHRMGLLELLHLPFPRCAPTPS